MPHLVTNRPRVGSPSQTDPDHESHDRWESISAWVYQLGGATFVGGSVFFLPVLSHLEYIGAWLFFIGSLLYLAVTGHDLFEIARFWRQFVSRTLAQPLEFAASLNYVTGSALFAIGSLFFLPWWEWSTAGAWCFIIGCVAFVLGATINLLQVVEAPSLVYLELFNITVAGFVVGSVLFLVASITYLWNMDTAADKYLVFTYAGWEYITGSLLFFIGGVVIHIRGFVRRALLRDGAKRTSMLTQFLNREISRYGHLTPDQDRR